MIEEFLNVRGGGIDFDVGILKTHPRLKKIKSLSILQKRKTIREYCDNYCQTHKTAIYHKIERVKNVWRKQEEKYITITEDFLAIFGFPKANISLMLLSLIAIRDFWNQKLSNFSTKNQFRILSTP